MQEARFATQRLDHLGLVAGICQEIELIEQIDTFLGASERNVSVGEAVQAMVLNGLGFTSRALYLTPEFFQNKPLDLLLRQGLSAEDLNDDSLGRALDRLYEAGLTEVFAQVSSHALSVFGIACTFVHLDSTSFSLHGNYAREGEQAIAVTHGYSKDRRPDLKQVVVNLLTSHRSAIPLWLEALSGNTSDQKSFAETVAAYLEQLNGRAVPYFVADSALYSRGTLRELSSIYWISRVPETIKAAKELVRAVAPAQMQPLEPGYAYYEAPSSYGEVAQRWLLIFSEQAYAREMAALARQRARDHEVAQAHLRQLARQRFACEADARQALAQVALPWRYHQAEGHVEAITGYRRPGRPKAGQAPEVIGYRIVAEPVEDAPAVRAAQASKGKFIVATNQLDRQALPAEKVFSAYKGQGVSVERGFRFLKDPQFFADSLFLKRPERLMALLMVMGLALLVYALAERKLRQALQQRGEAVPNQVGKPTQRPTMRRIFQVFEGIDVLTVQQAGRVERHLLNLTPLHRRIIVLLGPHVEKCYALRE